MARAQFVVRAVDGTKAAFASVRSGMTGLVTAGQRVGQALRGVFRRLRVAVLAIGAAAVASARQFAQFEAAARPFARFMKQADQARKSVEAIGDNVDSPEIEPVNVDVQADMTPLEQAQKHLKELQAIGRMGVIPTDELIEASREMMQFSDGLLGGAEDMKALADVAATTGNNVGQITSGVQRFMQAIAQGRNVQSASRDLERMGVLSLEARDRLRQLQDQGAGTEAMFAVLSNEINKFAGGVESDMDTGAASFGRLRASVQEAMIEVGDSVMNRAAPAMDRLSDAISDLRTSGDLESWAETAERWINHLIGLFGRLSNLVVETSRNLRRGAGFVGHLLEARRAGMPMRSAIRYARDFSKIDQDQRDADREERRAERRQRIDEAEQEIRSGAFAASADAGSIATLLAEEDGGERGTGRRGPSGLARRVLDRLRRTGEVEEFDPSGMGGALAGVRQAAQEQLRGDEQRDLMRRSVNIQEQIRDLLRRNLEAA